MCMDSPQALAAALEKLADGFLNGPDNDARMPGRREPAFGPAIYGYALAADPIWEEIKKTVHPESWTPLEAFRRAYPGETDVEPEELGIMAYVLPQTEATRRDQRAVKDFPCERWVRSRFLGQPRVVDGLAKFLLGHLHREDIQAICPDHLPGFGHLREGGPFGHASHWSQRHAAFAAGLGTFGLCDGLITPVGKSVRVGSLIIRRPLPLTPRPYTDFREYCLFYNSGVCAVCIKRCPIGAVTKQGHDKSLCAPWTLDSSRERIAAAWPDLKGAYGCGLCQAAVPCEKGIPPRPRPKR